MTRYHKDEPVRARILPHMTDRGLTCARTRDIVPGAEADGDGNRTVTVAREDGRTTQVFFTSPEAEAACIQRRTARPGPASGGCIRTRFQKAWEAPTDQED